LNSSLRVRLTLRSSRPSERHHDELECWRGTLVWLRRKPNSECLRRRDFRAGDRAAGIPEWERRQAQQAGQALDERWHQRKDGSRFWASGLLMPLKRQEAGFVKITRDRTEHHLANQRTRENEQRFRLLATGIHQLVFRTHPTGARTWGSPEWIEFTGLSLEESLGFGWLDAIHP
jgi:PAS domain-containing protein